MSSWKTHRAHETIINKSYKYKLNKNTTFVFQEGGDTWMKLFNQSSSNINVSACKTLNLRTFLMVDKQTNTLNHFQSSWLYPTINPDDHFTLLFWSNVKSARIYIFSTNLKFLRTEQQREEEETRNALNAIRYFPNAIKSFIFEFEQLFFG